MSKTPKKKKRKTRLKGTATMRPCVDCGKTKDRFKSFKPRWAGCVTHRTANGRRYFKKGCAECTKLVNGNIRQPRCIDCDKLRPKKRKKAEATPEITPTPEPVAVDPNPTLAPFDAATIGTPDEPTPEPVAVRAPEPAESDEPEVVGQDEPSDDSVKLPEPEAPKPQPKPQPLGKEGLGALFDLALGSDE